MSTIFNYAHLSGNITNILKQAYKDKCNYVIQFYSPLGGSFGTGDIKFIGIIGTYTEFKKYIKSQKHDPSYMLYKSNL